MDIINLAAGPGAGKSTTAAGLFHLMKVEGYSVELVTEYAKEVAWENREELFRDQLYLLAKQHRRLERLKDHDLDFVVTDSPLFLSLVYCPENYPDSFKEYVVDLFNSYDNFNIYINRVKPYVKIGRYQTESEARFTDGKLIGTLEAWSIPVNMYVDGDEEAPRKILERIREL